MYAIQFVWWCRESGLASPDPEVRQACGRAVASPFLPRKQDRTFELPRCVLAAVVKDPRDNPLSGVKGRLNLRHL